MKMIILLFSLLLLFQGTEQLERNTFNCELKADHSEQLLLTEVQPASLKKFQLNGIVVDENGELLIGANLLIKGTSTGTVTDIDGTFTMWVVDSCSNLVISYTGFDTIEKQVCSGKQALIALTQGQQHLDEVVVIGGQGRADRRSQRMRKERAAQSPPPPPPAPVQARSDAFMLSGASAKQAPATTPRPEPMSGDSYAEVKENDFITSDVERFSTFSIDVDAAGYSNMRRFLNEGSLPPTEAVRSEEMINYFRYSYPQPTGEHPFHVATELAECPWNADHQLLLVGMRGQSMTKEELPPANFVFLLDVSGSMNGPDRLGLLKSSLLMLTDNLREQDKVSIVVYAGSSGLVLEPTSGANKNKIAEALQNLRAGGSTAGAAGIKQAYEVARNNFVEDGNNRVILATDGDFNVGLSSNESLEELISAERENGIFLSVLGFGRGNLQDDKMEMLADKGNGNYAYIDQLKEARKVLVSEFGGTLFTIAKDVKIQLEFDPRYVRSYRLIGYENRLLNKEDFRDDTKDAGELGAGHTITALYEIVPAQGFTRAERTGMLRLRYKAPDSDTSQELAQPLGVSPSSFGQSSINLRWAAAVAEFSMLLRDSEHKGTATFEECEDLARQAQGRDPFGYRREMIGLIGKAQNLASAISKE